MRTRMRISTGRGWLAAAAALAITTVQGDVITFSKGFEGSFPDDNRAILSRDDVLNRQFSWTATDNIVVREVRLFTFDSSGPSTDIPIRSGKRNESHSDYAMPSNGHGAAPLPDPVTTPSPLPWGAMPSGEGEQTPSPIEGRNPQEIPGGLGGATPKPLDVRSDRNGGYVTFNNDVSLVPPGVGLYFQALWDGGISYSRRFTWIPNGQDYLDFLGRGPRDEYNNTDPYLPESGAPIGEPVADDPSPTTENGTPRNTQGTFNGVAPENPKSGPAQSGLPRGAVIGIAVGCGVAGLLLIFGVVWYLMRRRQQRKAMRPTDSSYSSGNRADELMAEKEAGADVDVTPHSPYSDEGASAGAGPSGSGAYPDGTAHGQAVAAGAVAAGVDTRQHLQNPPRSFTPYSDRPSAGGGGTPSARAASLVQTDEARVSVPSPVPGRATPRGLTTPYAHLVEEGMTEEEIRRLEEEERQLDAAIEQAGRR